VNSVDLYVNFDLKERPEKIDSDRLHEIAADFLCNDRWGGLLFNNKYKTFFYVGYFAEEDEYEDGDPKEGELIYPPFEKPMCRQRQVVFGSKSGDVKKITIELPRRAETPK
jgi:hypothetical protein